MPHRAEHDPLRPALGRLADRHELTQAESRAAFTHIMSGHASDPAIAAFLMALRVRGETTAELTGAVLAMRALMLPVRSPPNAIDLCGTGGDNRHTLNVSTATAFVVSASGVTVAKHGNRAVSSRSGAADILAALGIDPDPDPTLQEHRLQTDGLAFLHAPRHHPALRHAAPARAALGIRTILNLAGPLCNPANARRQLIGVYDPRWLVPMAETLRALGSERAWLVHGDGLDELTLSAETQVVALEAGDIRHFTVTPEDAGLPRAPITAITGADAGHNARALTALLKGEPGPYRDIVILNAAAALVIAGHATNLLEAADRAAAAIDTGAALAKLEASKGRGVVRSAPIPDAPRTPSKASL